MSKMFDGAVCVLAYAQHVYVLKDLNSLGILKSKDY